MSLKNVAQKCGVVNKFLTNYEDLMAVYSFGLQIDVTMQP